MLEDRHYVALSRFRTALARFLCFSERAARAEGITSTQYLLLLHARALSSHGKATVGELARRLHASAHGTTALVARCSEARLVTKKRSLKDGRYVEVRLTPLGRRLTRRIASRHRDELKSLRAVFRVAHVS
jgi:DNA-binding MarR family transcriptional regulator